METGLPSKYKTIKEDKNYISGRYYEKLESTEFNPDDRDDETTMRYNADQYRNKSKPFKLKVLVFFDTLLIGVYFTIIGYFLSWFVNAYTVGDLTIDKKGAGGGIPTGPYTIKDKKINVASELIMECLVIIVAVFAGIQIGLRLPSLIKKSPMFHKNYRLYSGGIILVYTLMSLQIDMRKKTAYVFSPKNYDKELQVQQLLDCIKDNTAGSGPFNGCLDSMFP